MSIDRFSLKRHIVSGMGIGPMKKLILSLTLTAFAAVAYAGDAKAEKDVKDAKTTGSCCAAKAAPVKTASADTAKAKSADCCGGCCKEAPVKQALLSPKAAAER